jgi:hypothetical protein
MSHDEAMALVKAATGGHRDGLRVVTATDSGYMNSIHDRRIR